MGRMRLPRLQLFELEDLPWFPPLIRDFATDYLQFIETRFALHKPAVAIVQRALEQSKVAQVVDLCSGAGGPVLALYEALAAEGMAVSFILTDKYPNVRAFQRLSALHPRGISYNEGPVDATDVPRELAGLRTMFNAFHHFSPEAARAILRCAVEARQPIGIFEIPERALCTLIPLLLTPVFMALATPFIRPFSWRRLLWTYLFPAVPLTSWWDGLVSQLRAYTSAEMLELSKGVDEFVWEADRIPIGSTPGHLTYLLGLPRAAAA